MKSRVKRKTRRGGGYGFGGSILSDAGGSGAGNALWNSDTSKDCGTVRRGGKRGGAVTNDSLYNRGGNNGGRRKRKGGADLAQVAPRTGYTFNGSGVAGTANTIPY
jgi:hypothetical protein